MILLLLISPPLRPVLISYPTWFGFGLPEMRQGVFVFENIYYLLTVFTLWAISIIPFYVLGKLVVHEVRGRVK